MTELFSKPGLIVPDSYKQKSTKPVAFDDIPEDRKEKIKCSRCGFGIFTVGIEHYKIKIEDKIGYAAKNVSVCMCCKTILSDKP